MLTIRSETAGDGPAIAALHASAFARGAEARLVDDLRQAPSFLPELSLVALDGEQVVAHVLFSEITLVMANDPLMALALAPVAVLPAYQRLGIGTLLVRHGLELCREQGHQIVIVVGGPAFYHRFGFRPAADFGLENNLAIAGESFMALELVPGALTDVSGMVVYPPVFAGV